MDEFLSAEELEKRMRDGEPLTLIDVRSPDEFREEHIPGAINIPVDELKRRLADLPSGQPVCTYCMFQHPGQTRSERAAQVLRDAGFEATVLHGGLPGWRSGSAGREVEESRREATTADCS